MRAALERSGLDHGPISVHDKMASMGLEAPSPAWLARLFRDQGVARAEPSKRPRAAWRRIVATSALSGVPAPAFASSLAYLDQLRAERLPAALIQGQRDFFGSHTYHRVDDPQGVYHVLWATPERAEEKWD